MLLHIILEPDLMKWRLAFCVLCDKNVPPKLRSKFYIMNVGSIMLRWMDYLTVKISHVLKIKSSK